MMRFDGFKKTTVSKNPFFLIKGIRVSDLSSHSEKKIRRLLRSLSRSLSHSPRTLSHHADAEPLRVDG